MTRRKFSLITAVRLSAFLLGGCSKPDYEWVMKIQDKDIPAGIYVMSEMLAYMQENTAADSNTAAETDENREARIEERAVENLKEYCFVRQEFEDRNLELTEETQKAIDEKTRDTWDNVKEVYENNGLTYDEYKEYLTYLCKEDLIFDDIYLNEDMITKNKDEIAEYLKSTISRVSILGLPFETKDGEKPTEDIMRRLRQTARDAVDSLNSGGDYETVANGCICRFAELTDIDRDYLQSENLLSTSYVNKSYTGYDEDFKAFIFEMQPGENKVYETENSIYIVSKLPLDEDSRDYDSMIKRAMHRLKDKEFEAYIEEGVSEYTIEINDEAISFYAPSKIKITLN